MCGILTVVSRKPDEDRFRRALRAVAHRGPDGEGILSIDHGEPASVMLGHCRLSIFDLSSAGAQPMSDGRGRSVTYNGEIFNWPELREELISLGYQFETQTDSEVLLAAYDRWGSDCVARFNGFWAFVIYDQNVGVGRPKLFMSRDRLGIKPIYYSSEANEFIVCSEIRPIYKFRGVKPEIDVANIADYLVFHKDCTLGTTFYHGIEELEPGQNAEFCLRSRRLTKWRYWAPNPPEFRGGDVETLNRFTEIFEDAVRIRLRSDREVALTLSGGIDSSAVAVATSRVAGGPVRAFTSHFPANPEIDETSYARMVAEHCGITHVLVKPDLTQLDEAERALTRHQELMYGGFSLLVNWHVLKSIKSHGIAVFLNGQGGDELFLGYERYLVAYLMHLFLSQIGRVPGEAAALLRNGALSRGQLIQFVFYFSSLKLRNARYRREAATSFSDAVMRAARGAPYTMPADLRTLQRQEVLGGQLQRLLRYDDRTAGAFGMEGRPVFLDHRLVEFGLSLGWEWKIRDGWTKFVVRRYLDKAGLPAIAWRRKKLGYNAPTLEWADRLLASRNYDTRQTAGFQFLKPGLEARDAPLRMQFHLLNLLSTAQEMEWS